MEPAALSCPSCDVQLATRDRPRHVTVDIDQWDDLFKVLTATMNSA